MAYRILARNQQLPQQVILAAQVNVFEMDPFYKKYLISDPQGKKVDNFNTSGPLAAQLNEKIPPVLTLLIL